MNQMLLIVFLYCLAGALSKDPLLDLPLSINQFSQIQTYFDLGNKKAKMNIDISQKGITVCCKSTETIFQKVYYFMTNPFFQVEDYSCSTLTRQVYTDSAKFQRLGYIQIAFNESIYPSCRQGQLGFNKESQFLSLLPTQQQFFIISSFEKREGLVSYAMTVGGDENEQSFYNVNSQSKGEWRFAAKKSSFNGKILSNVNIQLQTTEFSLSIPQKEYQTVVNELLNNYACISRFNRVLCPCSTGISKYYPKFSFQLSSQFNLQIIASSYFNQEAQVCQARIKESPDNQWKIHIFLFEKLDIKFNHKISKVGFSPRKSNLESNQIIKLPLQLTLNCFVILIMCIFVAMILIELMKRFSGLGDVRSQTFQNYMADRAQ